MPERSFGRTVRYRRTKLGLSQAELGELVGRTSSTIRSWERDKSAPNETSVLHALAAVLGVDERTLFEKAGQEPPPAVETSPTVEEALATLRPTLEAEEHEAEEHEAEEGETPRAEDPPEEDEPSRSDAEATDRKAEGGGDLEPEQMEIFSEPGEDSGSPAESEPVTVAAQQPRPGYVAPPEPYVLSTPIPPIAEPSYIEDEGQRQLYRVRNLATLVVVIALLVALLWALSESLEALGAWWDEFFGGLRL